MKKKCKKDLNFKLVLQDPVQCIRESYAVLDVIQQEEDPVKKLNKLLFPFLVTANHYDIDIRDALAKAERMILDLEENVIQHLKPSRLFSMET